MQARTTKRVRVRIRTRGMMLAIAVALISGSAAPPAGAASGGTDSLKIAQSRSSVLDYWTDARLDNARSADEKVPAGSSPEPRSESSGTGISGTPQLFEGTDVPTTGAQRATPHDSVPTEGKIFFTGSDGFDYMCSGTAVVSDNESTVWTAGHCVHGGPGEEFHSNWIFIPAYDDGETPYGVWTAAWLNTPNAWARLGSLKYDVGAAVVNTNDGATLGDTVGMAGIAFNQPASQLWTSLGYPAGPPWDGGDLISCDSRTLGRHNPDRLRGQRTMYINCNMNGGSSGGGWFLTSGGESYVGSVNSYGIRGHRHYMFGPYQGDAALALYNSMQAM